MFCFSPPHFNADDILCAQLTPSGRQTVIFLYFCTISDHRAGDTDGDALHGKKNHKKVRRLGGNALMDILFLELFFSYESPRKGAMGAHELIVLVDDTSRPFLFDNCT